MRTRKRVKGFTLVEMMVALLLSLIATSAVLAMYITTSKNIAQDEKHSYLQENSRYALKQITKDLVIADFWGQMLSPDTISTSLAVSVNSCADEVNLYDASEAILYNNYHISPATETFTLCPGIATDRVANTDVLIIKRVEGSPTATTFIDTNDIDGDSDTTEVITTGGSNLVNGEIYLRTNGIAGSFINTANPTNLPTTGEGDWRYIVSAYFIRDHFESPGDGIPALCRMSLLAGNSLGNSETGNVDEPQCIAQGVEDLHLEFGIDSDNDGYANQYLSAPTVTDLTQVVSAKVHLLIRSSTQDPGYTNPKTYQLGDVTYAAFNDNYYRRVLSTTVGLRNPTNLALLN